MVRFDIQPASVEESALEEGHGPGTVTVVTVATEPFWERGLSGGHAFPFSGRLL